MTQNLQVSFSGDGTYKINMRGKSFTLLLNSEEKTYEYKGDVPEEVKKDPKGFIEWLVPRLESNVKAGDYSLLQ